MENYDDEETIVISPPRTEHTLLATDDAQVWAAEFCRIFTGKVVNGDTVDEGLMVGWFANAIETGRSMGQERKPVHPGTWFAFLHFMHMDHANAAMHCASVRYSPITFRLAEFLWETYPLSPHPEQAEHLVHLRNDPRLKQVLQHIGLYEEDAGR